MIGPKLRLIAIVAAWCVLLVAPLSARHLSPHEQQDLHRWLIRLAEDLTCLDDAVRNDGLSPSGGDGSLDESLLTHEGTVFKQWRLAPTWRRGLKAIHDCLEPHLVVLDETRAEFTSQGKKHRFTDLVGALDGLTGRIEMDLGKPSAKERDKALQNLRTRLPELRDLTAAVLSIVGSALGASNLRDGSATTAPSSSAPGFDDLSLTR